MGDYDVTDDVLVLKLPRTEEGLPRVGTVVIMGRLGAGGMGTVYLGFDQNLAAEVAVKVLSFRAATDSSSVDRFYREARATFKVDHSNMVRVLNVAEEAGTYYLVMEFVDGESADARVKREGFLPERDALEIAVAAGEALAAAHAKGILHRDVKPANILIRFEDGRVKLADLGLAKALRREFGATTGLTATGQMLGTPAFMSPEQATDASRADECSDVYSLGATLYALLSGRAPFEATQLYSLLQKIVNDEPPDLFEVRPDALVETGAALRMLMAKAPGDRPRTMSETVERLRGCVDKAPVQDARGMKRPEMAGKRSVRLQRALHKVRRRLAGPGRTDARTDRRAARAFPSGGVVAPEATPAQEEPRGKARSDVRERRRVGTAPAAPVARPVRGPKTAFVVCLFLVLLGGVGGAAYFYSEEIRAALARPRKPRPEELAADEQKKGAERERPRSEDAEKKVASLLAAARTFRDTGLLDRARGKLAEALKLIPDHVEAKRLLDEVDAEIAARVADAERKLKYEELTKEALKLKLAGRYKGAAEAYERAAKHAPRGSSEAAETAAQCLHEYYKAEAANAEAEGDLRKAVDCYARALEKKDDPETREALAQAKQKLAATHAEEAKLAEAAEWLALAREAKGRGEPKAALGYFQQAAKRGADVARETAALERELECREKVARARTLIERRKWTGAASTLRAALGIRPRDKEALSLLARVEKVLRPDPTMSVDLDGGMRIELLYVRSGRFTMGSQRGGQDEKPAREVLISEGFYLGKCEVAQAQYKQVMGENPSCFRQEDGPVEQVSWNDADEFCRRLSERTGHEVRLPTEAEWEYACRAGSTGKFCYRDTRRKPVSYAWYLENAGGRTHPVGGKRPNAWGLHDMHGNVWEWCADWYGKSYYAESPSEDPKGPKSGGERALRGGSFGDESALCRSAARLRYIPSYRSLTIGFRVVVGPGIP